MPVVAKNLIAVFNTGIKGRGSFDDRCYADTVGLKNVRDAMLKYKARYGDLYWTPAPLLEELANAGKTFEQWSAERS